MVDPLLQIVKGPGHAERWVAWLRLPARRSQKKMVDCRSDSVSSWVGEYLQDPGSCMATVGLAKAAVACLAQRVDGWLKMKTRIVKERRRAEGIVVGVAPYCEVRDLDRRRDKELCLTRKGPRASAALRNELRRRMM